MEYQLQYNVCAALLCAIMLTTHLMRKKTKETHNIIFTILIFITMVGALVNIANTTGNMNPGLMDETLLILLDYLYFLLLNLPPFIFALYAIVLVKNSISSIPVRTKLLLFIPELILFGILLSNPFTSAVFKYNDGVYARGNLQIILYIISLYYTAFGAVYVLKEKAHTNWAMKFYISIFLIISYLTALIQLLNPEMLLQHMGMALSELVILLNLQKSGDYLNSELDVYNRRVLEKIVRMNLGAKKKMQILVLHIEDLNFILHNFGVENRTWKTENGFWYRLQNF